jgi:hypothetical protein
MRPDRQDMEDKKDKQEVGGAHSSSGQGTCWVAAWGPSSRSDPETAGKAGKPHKGLVGPPFATRRCRQGKETGPTWLKWPVSLTLGKKCSRFGHCNSSQFVALRRNSSHCVAIRRIRLTTGGWGGMEWNSFGPGGQRAPIGKAANSPRLQRPLGCWEVSCVLETGKVAHQHRRERRQQRMPCIPCSRRGPT